jgi:hypothetical protein
MCIVFPRHISTALEYVGLSIFDIHSEEIVGGVLKYFNMICAGSTIQGIEGRTSPNSWGLAHTCLGCFFTRS